MNIEMQGQAVRFRNFWNRFRFLVPESMGFNSKNRLLTVVFDSFSILVFFDQRNLILP